MDFHLSERTILAGLLVYASIFVIRLTVRCCERWLPRRREVDVDETGTPTSYRD